MTSEYLDWVETAAVENFKMQHRTADTLAKEATSTLAMMLAALGAVTAYAVKAISAPTPDAFSVGAVCLTVTLIALCAVLVWKCLMIQPIPAIFNEPKNLLGENVQKHTFDEIRRFELENMQEGIAEAIERNRKTARALNRIRLGAVISPVWFLVAICFHWAWAAGAAAKAAALAAGAS